VFACRLISSIFATQIPLFYSPTGSSEALFKYTIRKKSLRVKIARMEREVIEKDLKREGRRPIACRQRTKDPQHKNGIRRIRKQDRRSATRGLIGLNSSLANRFARELVGFRPAFSRSLRVTIYGYPTRYQLGNVKISCNLRHRAHLGESSICMTASERRGSITFTAHSGR
jgi:hypothetical protein